MLTRKRRQSEMRRGG